MFWNILMRHIARKIFYMSKLFGEVIFFGKVIAPSFTRIKLEQNSRDVFIPHGSLGIKDLRRGSTVLKASGQGCFLSMQPLLESTSFFIIHIEPPHMAFPSSSLLSLVTLPRENEMWHRSWGPARAWISRWISIEQAGSSQKATSFLKTRKSVCVTNWNAFE